MDLTQFFVARREQAKIEGDYAAYRSHLSKRLQITRRRLGIATKVRAAYTSKKAVTAEDIKKNHEYVHLLILTSERAWAHAMSMREAHSSEKDGITGSTRSHIVSRLRKACTYADHLYHMLSDKQSTGATDVDCYEARAYAYCLRGAMDFEKQAWEGCVKNYSEARVIYTALGILTSQDVFEELVADPIDPSIRYGAYQLGIPRTLAVSAVAQRYFPADSELVQALGHLDSRVLQDKPAQTLDAGSMPKHITWRSREVALEDASIATALALVNIASDCLAAELGSTGDRASGERASAYDNLLIASQDAVDATKAAIDDLLHEGINRSDKRIQSLQITKTALTYELISWRVGRYRVLLGGQDGVLSDLSGQPPRLPNERLGRQLGEQREKSVIYDAIIQSLEAIKELPGVAADSTLLLEIDAKHAYFEALKSLAIARSYKILDQPPRALALLDLAYSKCAKASKTLSSGTGYTDSTPPNIEISATQFKSVLQYLQSEVQRMRAIVELSGDGGATQPSHQHPYHVERLTADAEGHLNLQRLVPYPPGVEHVPVKPLFFDAAWNYIKYPGHESESQEAAAVPEVSKVEEQPTQQKKGWFGFGR